MMSTNPRLANAPIEQYQRDINVLARLYYGIYVSGRKELCIDLSDFEQVARIAVWEVAQKRPEMLIVKSYVSAAIKYAIFKELKKTRHHFKHVYLAQEYNKEVPIVDVLPTEEKGLDRLNELDDLAYTIKQEFSPGDAEALEALVDNCDDIYDLNLSELPTTDTKDRVGVVTKMDFNDEELLIYAQVLLGARGRVPYGYMNGERGQERFKKYFLALLDALGTNLREFCQSERKKDIFRKFRLETVFAKTYHHHFSALVREIDSSIRLDEIRGAKDKQKSFASPQDYNLHLLNRRGFNSTYEYNQFWARQKGFSSYSEYQKYRAEQKKEKKA